MSEPFFSVVMASYMDAYKHQASNPEEKLVRAINSVLTQEDFELIVVADDCQRTVDIVLDNFNTAWSDGTIRLLKTMPRKIRGKRNAGGAGIPRNAGIQKARGKYVIYLDSDDTYKEDYLKELKEEIKDKDWYWVDDLSWNKTTERFDLHLCDIDTQGACGTSNLIHKPEMHAYWSKSVTYLHDWMFIMTLKAVSKDYEKLESVGHRILLIYLFLWVAVVNHDGAVVRNTLQGVANISPRLYVLMETIHENEVKDHLILIKEIVGGHLVELVGVFLVVYHWVRVNANLVFALYLS